MVNTRRKRTKSSGGLLKPKFRSKFEENVWYVAKQQGYEIEYEVDKFNYSTHHVYLPDFKLPNGIYVETKGYLRPSDMKMKWVKKYNPHVDIRFVFMDASKPIRKGSKMTYGMWAEKFGFPYAEGSIPLEWYNE